MGLKQTQSIDTAEIPVPVLHTFSSERRAELTVPPGVFFYEEATFWDPSWTTANGGVQITDITDWSRSMETVGTGKLLSKIIMASASCSKPGRLRSRRSYM